MRWILPSLIVFTGLAVPALSGTTIDLSDARVVVPEPGKTIMVKAAEMLRDEVEKRTRISLKIVSELPHGEQTAILIGTGQELAGGPCRPAGGREIPASRDGYAVWTAAVKSRAGATVCAAGHDDRGTLFAVGRLLRALEMERDVLELDPGFRIVTAPRYPLRGHQLGYRPKTNSYDGWDLRMWEQYYRDLIVFGTNAVELIPPASDDAEYSRYFIGKLHEESFARGLFRLERNWVGPLKDNDGVDRTLELFQEMEKDATPRDKLNWRFQQALYRAYYDAYVRHRLVHELSLQAQAVSVLGDAERRGSLAAMDRAEAILDQADDDSVAPGLRLRVFELAEALFQSIRMQHSVEKHHSQRYHNLDDIDVPLNDAEALKERFAEIRILGSEEQRLARLADLASAHGAGSASSPTAVEFPDWTVEFDRYQAKRSRLWRTGGPGHERERQ